jgi:ribosomal protein S18 acetylase RimI-like enzyme
MIQLEPMQEADFEHYATLNIQNYAAGSPHFEGMSAEARVDAAQRVFFTKLMPDGFQTADQWLFNILKNGEKIGHLHFGQVANQSKKTAHLWDFLIYERHRGQGLGKDALANASQKLRQSGVERITLNVWGANKNARRLYESLKFEVSQLQMFRDL